MKAPERKPNAVAHAPAQSVLLLPKKINLAPEMSPSGLPVATEVTEPTIEEKLAQISSEAVSAQRIEEDRVPPTLRELHRSFYAELTSASGGRPIDVGIDDGFAQEKKDFREKQKQYGATGGIEYNRKLPFDVGVFSGFAPDRREYRDLVQHRVLLTSGNKLFDEWVLERVPAALSQVKWPDDSEGNANLLSVWEVEGRMITPPNEYDAIRFPQVRNTIAQVIALSAQDAKFEYKLKLIHFRTHE